MARLAKYCSAEERYAICGKAEWPAGEKAGRLTSVVERRQATKYSEKAG